MYGDYSVSSTGTTPPPGGSPPLLGFVGMGLMALGGIIVLIVGIPGSPPSMRLMGLLYIITAGLYLIFMLPLRRFADAASGLHRQPTYEGLAAALEHQRCFWRRLGIVMIASVALSILAMGVAMVVGIALVARN
jgi:hypothetical protein